MARQAVVGFGGVTRGGKSTLCHHLEKCLPNSVVVEMDQYYWDIHSSCHKRVDFADCQQFPDWDCFEAINWEVLMDDMERYTHPVIHGHQCPVVLVEGTMVLNYRPVSKLFTHRYFFTLPYDVAQLRRREIAKERFEPETYFDKVVWPAYCNCLNEQRAEDDGVVFLDGTVPVEENVSRVLAKL